MKLDNEFRVNAPLHRAWDILLDLEQVAPCLPGAALQSAVPQAGTQADYHGTITVKLGPITATYAGTVSVAEADEGVRRVVLKADGKDVRGHGLASATIVSTLSEESGGTRVRVETDMRVTGRIVQFGQGIMHDVASKLLADFAACLEQKIASSDSAPQEVERADGDTASPPPVAASAHDDAGATGEPTPVGTTAPRAQDRRSSASHTVAEPPGLQPHEAPALDLAAAGHAAALRRARPVIVVAAVALLVWLGRRWRG